MDESKSTAATSKNSSESPSPPVEDAHVSPKPADAPEGGRSKARVALIMGALCLAVFLAAIDITIITTALPTISEHFRSNAGYTWIGSAYLLASSASMPLWGKVSDIWGRKPVLLLANVVFFVGSLIAALAVNIGMLIVARAIQGIGGGGLVILVNIVISDLFSMRNRSLYFGIIGMVWALASALGPIVGGAFTDRVSWRWCFYINLPFDGVAFLIIMLFLDIQTPTTPLWEGLKAIDWLGSLTIVGGTLMLLLGLQFGGVTYPWSSAKVVCLIVFGAVAIALFFLAESRLAKYPIMPIRLFNHRSNLAALGVCFIHGWVFIAGSYYLPLYFQAVLGATPLLSGVYLIAFALSLSTVSAITGIIIRKTGQYLPCIWFGMAVMTLGFGLYINLDANSSWAKIILFQIVAGIGVGPNFQSPLLALQARIHPRDIATATATFGFVRNLATSISVVIGGVVFQNEMQHRASTLQAALGPSTASQISGDSAGANVATVQALPPAQRQIVRQAYADSLSRMWILYTAFAGFGLLISFLIVRKQLSQQHVETKTGLEAEREKRQSHLDEQKRKSLGGTGPDGEQLADLEAAAKPAPLPAGATGAQTAHSGKT